MCQFIVVGVAYNYRQYTVGGKAPTILIIKFLLVHPGILLFHFPFFHPYYVDDIILITPIHGAFLVLWIDVTKPYRYQM